MKPTKSEILRNVFQLAFDTQYELAATFLRFQEHYESPRFKGEYFTLEQYMDWYAALNGNFTYYSDWSGFNIPSHTLAPFRDGEFDPLSRKEEQLLSNFPAREERFYIIGVLKKDVSPESETLQHELAHALFFIDEKYRREVTDLLTEFDTERTSHEMVSAGYHPSVVKDEIQAYLVSGIEDVDVFFSESLINTGPKIRELFQQRCGVLRIN